jgi:hypothetical protein
VVLRLTRWRYRCRECHHDYDLPGADLSFFYGWFLGISPGAEAVVFDAVSFDGFDELAALVDSLADKRLREGPGRGTAVALTEVCDPDSRGNRYVFTGTPGCPTCTSAKVETFTETLDRWALGAGEATHVKWDSMAVSARLTRLRVAFGLYEDETANRVDLGSIESRYRRVITDCAAALLAGTAATQCRSTGLAHIQAVRSESMAQIDEYGTQPLVPANTRWRLVTKLDHMHRQALDQLDALVQPHV